LEHDVTTSVLAGVFFFEPSEEDPTTWLGARAERAGLHPDGDDPTRSRWRDLPAGASSLDLSEHRVLVITIDIDGEGTELPAGTLASYQAACDGLFPDAALVTRLHADPTALRDQLGEYEQWVYDGDGASLYRQRFPLLFLNKLTAALIELDDADRREEVEIDSGLIVLG
jgi:hypothetical protein